MKAVVYGHTGVVGTQTYRWLLGIPSIEVAGVSLDQEDGDSTNPDWVFVCVPTPTGDAGEQNLENIYSALAASLLFSTPSIELNIVIRSTVLPGTCVELRKQFPKWNWNIFHWPEFLSARTAERDFLHPYSQIIGGDYKIFESTWGEWLPRVKMFGGERGWYYYTDVTTAEILKYIHNIHGAMQIIFANLIWDICEQSHANFEEVKRGVAALEHFMQKTLDTYWNIFKDGYRGFDGACFPKDVAALRYWLGDKAELLEGIERANKRLREEKHEN